MEYRDRIVGASELPRDRSTLLVRFMAAGPLLPEATAELAALEEGAHERTVAELILVDLEPTSGARSYRKASTAHDLDEERAMSTEQDLTFEGGCTCRRVRYRMVTRPMFVHCCHCRWCQRETGASFALNAMIEADRVELRSGEVDVVNTPSNSGKGQRIARCPTCRVAVWSNYAGAGDAVRFVRVGTLDDPDRLPPDIHIFTSSKQPWVVIDPGTPAVVEYYKAAEYWPKESLERRAALLAALAKP